MLLWPFPAAAAGAPGVPGFPVGAVPLDDGRQAAGAVPAGMTSEMEVLRALKLLFEHHKALDEKQMILKEENNQEKILPDGVLDVNHEQENMPSANGKASPWSRSLSDSHHTIQSVQGCWNLSPMHHRPSNGSLSHEEDLVKVVELQEVLDKQSREHSQMKERLTALSAHVTELEEDLDMARKDLLKCEDDDLNDKLENEIENKDSMHRQTEDKNRQLQERLELVEKLQQSLRRAETLPEVEAELAQKVAALSKAGETRNIDERLRQMEPQLEEKNKELQRVVQGREKKMNEEHNKRLSDTVDKLLSESDEKLQLHLKERMAALENKNVLKPNLMKLVNASQQSKRNKAYKNALVIFQLHRVKIVCRVKVQSEPFTVPVFQEQRCSASSLFNVVPSRYGKLYCEMSVKSPSLLFLSSPDRIVMDSAPEWLFRLNIGPQIGWIEAILDNAYVS
ncbi:hypothetical protein E5288_WYG021942 [Bos mutus]|uniref:Liprin-alpha CC2 domain-containing protein n=1 Tax=Bos mutus TaxID=72004 RepID=A0A6B0RYL0_9CETA|nr:hypothetical protein [Bos mutus]